MGSPRRDPEQAKAKIIKAARALFAERGIGTVTVRDIAGAAGVAHGLVHHHFGSKEQLIAEIVRREVNQAADAALSFPDADVALPLDSLPWMERRYLTEERIGLLLIARAELAGLEPEKMIEAGTPRPLQILATRLAERQAATGMESDRLDPVLVSAYIGAATFALATMYPWLMTAVGLTPDDHERSIDEFVKISVALAALATGSQEGVDTDSRHP